MGKFRIEIEDLAKKHLAKHYKSGNKAVINRVEKILKELSETPFEGTGKPEALKHELSGLWSRRISTKDRIIYEVLEKTVLVRVISALGHYE